MAEQDSKARALTELLRITLPRSTQFGQSLRVVLGLEGNPSPPVMGLRGRLALRVIPEQFSECFTHLGVAPELSKEQGFLLEGEFQFRGLGITLCKQVEIRQSALEILRFLSEHRTLGQCCRGAFLGWIRLEKQGKSLRSALAISRLQEGPSLLVEDIRFCRGWECRGVDFSVEDGGPGVVLGGQCRLGFEQLGSGSITWIRGGQ